MYTSYRVQRLLGPPENEALKKVSRAFGGRPFEAGDPLWDYLQTLCNLDYMGAAEYEFGALATCLKGLRLDQSEVEMFDFIMKGEEVKPNFYHEHEHKMRRRAVLEAHAKAGTRAPRGKPFKPTPIPDQTLYLVCRKSQKTGALERIKEMAMDRMRTKNENRLAESLDPIPGIHRRDVRGWLELDNGFVFTLDKSIAEGFLSLVTAKTLSE